MSGNFDCQAQGNLAKSIANIRDDGAPQSSVLQKLNFRGSTSMRKIAERIAADVYHSDWDAKTAYNKILTKCEKNLKARDAILNN